MTVVVVDKNVGTPRGEEENCNYNTASEKGLNFNRDNTLFKLK